MCARIIQTTEVDLLGRIYRIDTENTMPTPRHIWNGPPGTHYPVIRTSDGRRELASMRWGLVPARAIDATFAPVNARSETVAVKPTFREAFAHRRCIFPVNGWYEWQRRPGARARPHVIDDGNGGVLHLAGIWERWNGPEGLVDGFAVLTTTPSNAVAAIHHRQPSVLELYEVDEWLDLQTSFTRLRTLAGRGTHRMYRVRSVSCDVNDARNDGPHLLAAAG